MSKSTPSTSTTTNINPIGQAQVPYMTNMWGQAAGLGGWDFGSNSMGTPVGQGYLDQMRNYAQSNFNASAPSAGNLVPGANNFVNAALSGNAGGYLPAAGQIGGLNSTASAAENAGNVWGGNVGSVGSQYMPTVAPYMSGLTSLAGQYQPLVGAGYGTNATLSGLGGQLAGAAPGALSNFSNLSGSALTAGNPSEAALMANSGMAINSNPAFSSGLQGLASGQYINPSTNPALGGMISAATDPIVKQYMTATAPGITSGFETGGRYGSGAATNATGQGQYALGQAIQNATSNIVNNAYNQGLTTTLGAGSALGNIFNSGVANSNQAAASAGGLAQSGVSNAGNILGTGYNTYGGLTGSAGNLVSGGATSLANLAGLGLGGQNTALTGAANLGLQGLQGTAGAYSNAGQLVNAGYGTGASALAQGGNLANSGVLNLGGLAQMAPDLSNYPLSQLSTAFNSNWAPIQNYAAIMGSPIGGNTTTTQTTPYYSNTASNILGGALGVAKLASLI